MLHKDFRHHNRAEGKKPGKAVSIYINLGRTGDDPGRLESQGMISAPDNFTVFLYVDYRHGIARSYYLIPPTIRLIHVIIEDAKPGIKVVDFLDNNLHTLRNIETTASGTLLVKVSEFLNGCCYLRLSNGRLLCMSIDKWPDLLPPFLRH